MMMRHGLLWGALGTMALAGLAQDSNHYGLQLLAARPVGTLRSKEGMPDGYGLGVHARFPLKPGHVLQPRLDLMATEEVVFETRLKNGMLYRTQGNNLTSLSIALEYLYFLEGQTQGWYAALGLGQQRWGTMDRGGSSSSHPVPPADILPRTPSETLFEPDRRGLLASLGGGYQITRRTGFELRFMHSRIGKADAVANTLRLGVTFSF